nr:glia-derived nexin-like [Penaeus vannamei]
MSTVLLPIKRAFEVLYWNLVVPDAAAADINAFINAETRGKIPKLIEPSFVKDAKMVLTNAVYFKGFWKYPFKPQRTHKDKFFVTPEECPSGYDDANGKVQIWCLSLYGNMYTIPTQNKLPYNAKIVK